MNADHAAQLLLLDVQASDTALAQLAHKRKTLPELAELQRGAGRDTELHSQAIDVETQLGDIDADQKRLESEIETVRARAARDNSRLQSGGLPAKELESLQHEITTLARRQSTLEDELLEVMERHEEVEGSLATLRAARAEVAEQTATLTAARDAAFAEIDAAASARAEERAGLASGLPADLLALYEKAREHGGGVGAAMLRQRRCEGCHIELSGSELNSVRAAAEDDVVRCDNCRRILVRTAESGL
ncbi:MAG TPA: C4-type zinc ribbon domain-containing protein [Jatrophihabitans sp.]